jgi:putative ATPase
MADPRGLLMADAAARAVEFVGLPEASLNLAHAVIYLASAPKSGGVKGALLSVQADVRERPAGAVPVHLRDTSYRQARRLGHGKGYLYPHDDPRGWVEQEYRPPEVADRVYYRPTEHGEEGALTSRWPWGAPSDDGTDPTGDPDNLPDS